MSVINTNVAATIASNSLVRNERDMSNAMERLSTGLRINSAKDDAAGLAIASRMTSQITGLNQAVRNANDAVSLLQTAEGATNEITNMLQRMRELAVQSRSDSNTQDARDFLQLEFAALQSEISRIANNTQFNTLNILDGTFTGAGSAGKFEFQVGANAGQLITSTIGDFTAITGLGSSTPPPGTLSFEVAVDAKTATSGNPRIIDFTGTDPIKDQIFFVTIGDGTDAVKLSYTAANNDKLSDVLDGLLGKINPTTLKADGINALAVTATKVGNSLVLTEKTALGGVGALNIKVESSVKLGTAAELNPAENAMINLTANKLTLDMEGIVVASGQKFELTVGNIVFDYTAKNGDGIAEVAAGLAVAANNSDGFEKAVVATSSGSTLLIQVGGTADTTFKMKDEAKTAVTTALVFLSSSAVPQPGGEALTIATNNGAEAAITSLDTAIKFVNTERASMGATLNQLTYATDNLANVAQNTEASRSRIQDADYAKETTELARTQIIAQAGTAMLAQANQVKQTVLSLLK